MKLKINEAASFLNLPVNTLKRWIRQGRVPINKSGETCIFKKNKLEEWARKNNICLNSGECKDNTKPESEEKILSSAVAAGRILYNVDYESKKDIFSYVVDSFSVSKDLKQTYLQRLIERENMTSTGIGRGVAIPHPREPVESFADYPQIITVFLKNPVDFDSIDNKKVFVLFFIVCTKVEQHLKLLSNISFCLRHDSFIDFLKKEPLQKDLVKQIEYYESELGIC
ncbi:MAG: PTS sugar transporter subunit IIA [Thermodesulfobacteriota bacterium]